MRLKLVRLLMLVLAIGFSLASCNKKSTDPEPETAKKYYPLSITRTASYTSDITRSEFTYNDANQVVREAIYKNDVLQNSSMFFYDASGKFTSRELRSETGLLTEQENITYNPAGFADRLSHAYVDAAGKATPHHYRVFEFNGEGKISKWTDFKPDGTVINSRTYTYNNSGKVTSPSFDNSGQHVNTSEITLDQNPTPFRNTTINLAPYTGNELKHEIKDLSGNVILSYSNTISYNAAGYPEKITQTYSDGTVKTETYTYRAN